MVRLDEAIQALWHRDVEVFADRLEGLIELAHANYPGHTGHEIERVIRTFFAAYCLNIRRKMN